MKLKRCMVGAALISICALSSAKVTNELDFSSGPDDTFAGQVRGITSGTDIFNFTLSTPVIDFGSGVLSIRAGERRDIDFTSITLSGGSLTSPLHFVQVGGDPVENWAFTLPSLAQGDYSLALSYVKSAGALSTAKYSGTIAVTPVPEPESYAMMLAGLGAIGFMMARRRNADR